MAEAVQFWLENKMSAGIRVAVIGAQSLVMYRERYYVVEKDAAQTKGGKPLRYSQTSMPLVWKKAMKGEPVPADVLAVPADDALPEPTVAKRTRKAPAPVAAPVPAAPALPTRSPLAAKKSEVRPPAQSAVAANCPHCNARHDIPVEKGRNGKPFFMACTRCKADFAVRFVPVTVFQAQVAGFR